VPFLGLLSIFELILAFGKPIGNALSTYKSMQISKKTKFLPNVFVLFGLYRYAMISFKENKVMQLQ
jgi:hypothetical protein